MAKKSGGKFLLRIEDTDQARSTKLYEDGILDSMRRCGLDRDAGPEKEDDHGPYFQMQRLDIYNRYLQDLLSSGKAYYAWETSEELDAMREVANAAKKPFRYRKRAYTDEQLATYQAEWRKPVIRLEIDTNKVVEFTDMIKGDTIFKMAEFGDLVIVKWDGIPTYHFAVVVDDIEMNVTHVVRGEDHFTNTAKHICIYEAIGHTKLPTFAHLPLMLNPFTGKKLSKRDTEVWLTLVPHFRDAWFLPEAVMNFIALVWRNPGTEQEIFSLDELIAEFDISRVQKSNAKYDFKRALWFNSEYIKALSDQEFVQKTKDYLYIYGDEQRKEIVENSDDAYRLSFAADVKMRTQTLAQFRDHGKYLFLRPAAIDEEMVCREKMKITPELVAWFLSDLIHTLEHITDSQRDRDFLKEELIGFIKAKELKNGQVLRPIRAILTGVEASPGAFEMLDILGKEESIVRLKEYM